MPTVKSKDINSYMADAYVEFAEENFEDNKGSSYLWDGNENMMDMFRSDRKNHLKAAKLIRAGKITKAAEVIQHMDTAARDLVPDMVYDYCMKEGYKA